MLSSLGKFHLRTGECKDAIPWSSGPSLGISQGSSVFRETMDSLRLPLSSYYDSGSLYCFPSLAAVLLESNILQTSLVHIAAAEQPDIQQCWAPNVMIIYLLLGLDLFVHQAAFKLKVPLFQTP